MGAYLIREKLAAYVARMLRIAPVAGVIPGYLPDILKDQLGIRMPEFFCKPPPPSFETGLSKSADKLRDSLKKEKEKVHLENSAPPEQRQKPDTPTFLHNSSTRAAGFQ